MKHVRKGFTLVELLIVIAILGSLSATMSVATSGSTARAKASAIAANVDACKSAAMLYYIDNMDNDNVKFDDVTTDQVLFAYCKTWKDFKNGKIKYTAVDNSKGRDNWAIEVDFNSDPEASAIKSALAKIKGYGIYGTVDNNGAEAATADRIGTGNKFKVMLTTGEVTAVTTGS